MLHYSKLLSEPFDPFDELRASKLGVNNHKIACLPLRRKGQPVFLI
jgi:hypothetical protein